METHLKYVGVLDIAGFLATIIIASIAWRSFAWSAVPLAPG